MATIKNGIYFLPDMWLMMTTQGGIHMYYCTSESGMWLDIEV